MADSEYPGCSPAVEDDGDRCSLFRCLCCWRKNCPPHIPRVDPGREFVCTPADGDHDPRGRSSLAAPPSRFRSTTSACTASGQIMGHNNQLLEPLLTVSPNDDEDGNNFISHASAALAPDGLRLYGFYTHVPGLNGAMSDDRLLTDDSTELRSAHRAFSLDLANKSVSSLPPLPFVHGAYLTVSAHDIPYRPLVNSHLSGTYLQGYAVVGNRFILLSLIDSTFFCFDCAVGSLTTVTTAGKSYKYKPISGKAVRLGGDDANLYFLKHAKLLAYKFSPEEGKLLAPPVEVNRPWPYDEEGYGSIVHLTQRMLCAVWINMNDRHALITTFIVKGDHHHDGGCFTPSSVEVLHSTCRRVDTLRSNAAPRYEAFDTFCFLHTKGGKLTCHEKLMEPLLSLETITPGECGIDEPPSWHFVNLGSKIYVIPSVPSQNHYDVDVNRKLSNIVEHERPDMCFTMVSRAGQHTVALGDTLSDVYVLDEPTFKWLPFKTSSSSVDLTRKADICGFVDLIDDALVVSDVGKAECFLLDLRKHEWFVVKPPWGMWNRVEGALCGRCLFAEGFIYTCTGVGFAAFELLKENTSSYSLDQPVLMEFPCIEFPDKKSVSFDLISKENNPSCMVFCVVQGNFMTAPFTSHHKLTTTTVKVKLEGSGPGKKKPLRIDHIDISKSTIDQKGWIWTNYCFVS
ncbi:hypothetical protein PR202_ga07682 [Eleusine coracana subsp. coracana]|uniref:Uncharacterized protein n=1 Tax=Eleusine coracana subsp. coracana TaxID=191504 RepID=A0AAV5BYE6_ELECO|nr:hypothetical protein PR202_ga07682 [Eleusine coracana subsp. coracana]